VKPRIEAVRELAESFGATKIISIFYDDEGNWAAVSWGKTKLGCRKIATVCDTISDMIEDGTIPDPNAPRVEIP